MSPPLPVVPRSSTPATSFANLDVKNTAVRCVSSTDLSYNLPEQLTNYLPMYSLRQTFYHGNTSSTLASFTGLLKRLDLSICFIDNYSERYNRILETMGGIHCGIRDEVP